MQILSLFCEIFAIFFFQKKTFHCSFKKCKKQFETSESLKQHKKIHYAKQCNICAKKFFDNKKLSNHLNIFHNESNSIQCEYCKIFLKKQRGLRKHLKKCPIKLAKHNGSNAKKSKRPSLKPAWKYFKIPKLIGPVKHKIALENEKKNSLCQTLAKPKNNCDKYNTFMK